MDFFVKIMKFADDTTIIGLIHEGSKSAYRLVVDQVVLWSSHNKLELNTAKTVEMILDFREKPPGPATTHYFLQHSDDCEIQ